MEYPGNSTNFKNAFIFIDGNNIVIRFQEILKTIARKEGIKLEVLKKQLSEKNRNLAEIIWEKDKFLWSKSMNNFLPSLLRTNIDIVRAYYYTYCDENNRKKINDLISNTKIVNNSNSILTLTPEIIAFTRGEQAKGDDIKICLDSMRHAINGSADIICLFTGDGDFLPLVEELQKMGKLVFVAAFDYLGDDTEFKKAVGLNQKLKNRADYFINLSPIFGNFAELIKRSPEK